MPAMTSGVRFGRSVTAFLTSHVIDGNTRHLHSCSAGDRIGRQELRMDIVGLANRYVSLWNEPDEKKRRDMVEALWTPGGNHFVGTRAIQGYGALEQRVAEAHHKNVVQGGHLFSLRSAFSVHDAVMLDWTMHRAAGGDAVAAGRDVLLVDSDQRIVSDYQVIVA